MLKRFAYVWKLLAFLLIAVFSFSVIFASFNHRYEDKFYPGVIIGGASVSGKKYSDVSSYYKEKADLINKNGITIFFSGKKGKKEINIRPFSTGLSADNVFEYFSIGDWESALKQAYNFGRNKNVFENIIDQATALAYKKEFDFPYLAEEEAIMPVISQNLDNLIVHAFSAEFKNNENGVYIEDETVGEKVDKKEIIAVFKKRLANLDAENIYISSQEDLPIVTRKKLEPFLSLAKKIYSLGLDLYYKEHNWKVSGSELISWLTVSKSGKLAVDEKKLDYFVSKTIAPYVDSPAINSRFEMISGKPVEIVAGRSGNTVDIKKLLESIEKEIFSEKDNTAILVEVKAGEPRITKETISRYDIKELVGKAVTNFKGGSLDRQHNIEVGCSKLNGILIAPGEEFSAVKAIGEVSEEAGFVKEYVIKGDSTTKEVGGGLCQIATTLFRLALDAGLPITERTNHRYVISYYGPGLDATIYDPKPDLKFVNDTKNYILLQAKAKNNEVVLEFYGKKDGRQVEISKPVLYDEVYPPDTKNIYTSELLLGKKKCTEIPHKGITADAVYTVYYLNGTTRQQKFHSVYQPWQEVCLIGTGY